VHSLWILGQIGAEMVSYARFVEDTSCSQSRVSEADDCRHRAPNQKPQDILVPHFRHVHTLTLAVSAEPRLRHRGARLFRAVPSAPPGEQQPDFRDDSPSSLTSEMKALAA
jgi:hypothetical protein